MVRPVLECFNIGSGFLLLFFVFQLDFGGGRGGLLLKVCLQSGTWYHHSYQEIFIDKIGVVA